MTCPPGCRSRGCCRRIYSSHFFEHLKWDDGERLLEDCFFALRPQGRFRMAVPDFELICRLYLAGDGEYFERHLPRAHWPIHARPGSESVIDFVNYAVYQDGEHLCMFDGAKAVGLLTAIGFRDARVVSFDPDWDLPDEVRREFTLYVEATR